MKKYSNGDWVKVTRNEVTIYGLVDTIAFDDIVGNFSNGTRYRFHSDEVSPMTDDEIAEEKKRRWWERLGREVDEYRIGDIIYVFEDEDITSVDAVYANFVDADGYYEAVSKKGIKLISPVEQRLDIPQIED